MKPRMVRRTGSSPQQPATRRSRPGQEQYEDERPAPPAPPPDKTPLYIGIGVGAVVLIIIIAVAMGGGDSPGSGGSSDRALSRAMSTASEAYNAGQYRKAMGALEPILNDTKYRRHPRYAEVERLAGKIRENLDVDRVASQKVGDFKRKVETAKADGTMMKKAVQFRDECNDLISLYRFSTSGNELAGLKEDIMRCVNTESQTDWQNSYNREKARIETKFLAGGNFGEAARAWRQFGEINTQDPLLRTRIDQEVRTIDQQAASAAEKLVTDVGSGADARGKLEEAQQSFNGTAGQEIIKKALRSLK